MRENEGGINRQKDNSCTCSGRTLVVKMPTKPNHATESMNSHQEATFCTELEKGSTKSSHQQK